MGLSTKLPMEIVTTLNVGCFKACLYIQRLSGRRPRGEFRFT